MRYTMNARDEIKNELKELGLHALADHMPIVDDSANHIVLDHLAGQIMDKIAAETHLGPKVRSKVRILQLSVRRTLAYAATLLLLIATATTFWILDNRSETLVAEDNLLEDYFPNIADTDRGLFYDLIHSNGVNDHPQNVVPAENNNYSDFIMEYLLDVAQLQGIEPEEFFEQTADYYQPE